VLAHHLVLVRLPPALAELLRLGRPALQQPDRQQDELDITSRRQLRGMTLDEPEAAANV
jgi:hypothetical protein